MPMRKIPSVEPMTDSPLCGGGGVTICPLNAAADGLRAARAVWLHAEMVKAERSKSASMDKRKILFCIARLYHAE